jgi:hypothetical protein
MYKCLWDVRFASTEKFCKSFLSMQSFKELESNTAEVRNWSSKQSVGLSLAKQSGTLFEWGSARGCDELDNNKQMLRLPC